MHHPVYAEKRAKRHCNCIGLNELRGPLGDGGENFLWTLMGCTQPLVGEGNG